MSWNDPTGPERRPGDPWPPPVAGPPPVGGAPYGAGPSPYEPAPAPRGTYPPPYGPQPAPWGPPPRRGLSGAAIALIVVGALLVLGVVVAGLLAGVRGVAGGPALGPDSYGDDAYLDQLWDRCEAGDGAACDELYWESPAGSEYEEFGDTCGRRFAPGETFCDGAVGRPESTV